MTKLRRRAITTCLAGAVLASGAAAATAQNWSVTGADTGQSGWQKNESLITKESASTKFKFLWKIDLGKSLKGGESFSEPLISTRLINSKGFKDVVFTTSADTLYAVDSELGTLMWKKQFDAKPVTQGCRRSSLGLLIEPPPVINFQARRAPGAPAPAPTPAQLPPAAPSDRRLGIPAGGGGFGLKGIYVLSPDGMLHEIVQTTGLDFAPPVKFLPSPNGNPSGLTIRGKAILTTIGQGCQGEPGSVWTLDMATADYPVANFKMQTARPLTLTGPAIAPDGTAYIVTGPGASDQYANSVVALGADLKPKDWYTPTGAIAKARYVSPITFNFKSRQLVAAPGKDGSVVLLDATSLGGSDHHTPLAEATSMSKPGTTHTWDGFAAWTDKSGMTWLYASLAAPFGNNPHGGIVAFKVVDADGKLSLVQSWTSPDMLNPAPPAVANGVVIALAGGDPKTHATLSVLDAATGSVLFSSKETIPTYTNLSGVSIGDGHAFFTDHDGTLYSFGIGMEH